MSTWLSAVAKPGDRMTFLGPSGSFYLRPVERPLVMLAGGTGLAPLLSMLETLAQTGTDHPIQLLYGVTRDEDLVETARLEALSARLVGFQWQSCVADPASAHKLKGYVTDHLANTQLQSGACDVYLCGPPPMVEAVRQGFAASGVNPVRFFYEKFAVSVSV